MCSAYAQPVKQARVPIFIEIKSTRLCDWVGLQGLLGFWIIELRFFGIISTNGFRFYTNRSETIQCAAEGRSSLLSTESFVIINYRHNSYLNQVECIIHIWNKGENTPVAPCTLLLICTLKTVHFRTKLILDTLLIWNQD